jgi:hypothetical protein
MIKENLIDANSGIFAGGGIRCKWSDVKIIANVITNNYGRGGGGGVGISWGTVNFTNNIISHNLGPLGGGLHLMLYDQNFVSNNNIFFGNVADSGGAVYINSDTANNYLMIASNSIFWGDTAVTGNEIFPADRAEVTYSNIEGGFVGQGNIDIDPQFRDPLHNDFHLISIACGDSADSPCIDAGDPNILDSLLDCSWGLGGARSDMGAYGGGDSVSVGIFGDLPSLPERFILLQNYPNPFNSETKIKFTIVNSSVVRLAVYDLLGREVQTLVDQYLQSGLYTATFEANNLSSGIYYCRLQVGEAVKTKPMVLLK